MQAAEDKEGSNVRAQIHNVASHAASCVCLRAPTFVFPYRHACATANRCLCLCAQTFVFASAHRRARLRTRTASDVCVCVCVLPHTDHRKFLEVCASAHRCVCLACGETRRKGPTLLAMKGCGGNCPHSGPRGRKRGTWQRGLKWQLSGIQF